MNNPSEILVDATGPVARLTLNRPYALNALTPQLLTKLGNELENLANEVAIRLIVITGAGRAFSAGVDLKALGDRSLDGGSVGVILDEPARRVIDLITSMPKLVLAKVNGFCFTGALELTLACDLVVVADEARFGDTHAKFGLRPTWGMSQRLIRAVGPAKARELSYTSRTFTGREAVEWGIAVQSVPLEQLDQVVDRLIEQVLANSDGSLAAYKDLFSAALDKGLGIGLEYEARTNYVITDTNDRLADFR